jgi:cell division protein FtsZ
MEAAHEDAEIIFGTVIDEQMNDKVKVTVIATGLGGAISHRHAIERPALSTPAATVTPPPVSPALQAQMAASMQNAAPPAPMASPAALPFGSSPQASSTAGPNAPAGAQAAGAPVYAPTAQKNPSMLDEDSAEPALASPGNSEGGELARARAIAQRLGITNLTDDEYDVPTYLRRQQDRET